MLRSKNVINKSRKVFLGCLAVVTIIAFLWLSYSIVPTSIKTDLSYVDELASIYRHTYLKQFNCTNIEYKDHDQVVVISFDLKTRPERKLSMFGYSSDECIDDIVKIRDKTSNFLKEHPENELNNKKICFNFHTYVDEVMHMYNYNFQDNIMEKGTIDFCYYTCLEVHDITKLEKLSNAKILDFSTDVHYTVSDMSVFDDFSNLEVINCPKFFSDDAIDYLKNKFPNCKITQ